MLDRKRVFDDLFDTFCMLSGDRLVSLYDAQTQVTRWVPAAVRLFALPGEYFDQGAYNWEDSIHPDDRKSYTDCMTKLVMGRVSSYDISYRVRIFDGSYILCRNIGGVIRGENGMPDFIGGNVLNEGVIDRMCPLTGLRNRRGLADDEKKLAEEGKRVRALFVKIEDFGGINDAYGYSFGNKYLLRFAEFLTEKVAGRGTLYRVSGAGFCVADDSGKLGEDALDALRQELADRLAGTFVVDGIIHRTQLTGGIKELPASV